MRYLGYLLITLVSSLAACTSPLQNVELSFRKPLPTAAQVTLQTSTGEVPKNAQVHIKGLNADQVVNLLNTTNFRIAKDGRLDLATRTAASADHPLQFTLVASADDCFEAVVPVTLSAATGRQVTAVLVAKNQNQTLPLLNHTTAGTTTNGTVSAPVQMETTAPVASAATMILPAGVQLLDVANQPVNGQITADLKVLPINNETASAQTASQLPNGGAITSIRKIASVGSAVQIDLYNQDYQLVKTFSRPIEFTFGLDPKARNLMTGQPIQPGDGIQIFSYDAATNQWQDEATGKITLDGKGKLVCKTTITHLTDWVAGYTAEVCSSSAVRFSVTSQIPDNYDYPYRVEAFYMDGERPESVGNFYYKLQNGATFSLQNILLKDRPVKLKIYDRNSQAVVESPVVSSCANQTVPLDVRAFRVPTSETPIAVKIQFPCSSLQLDKLPDQVTTYFRESGTSNWHPLLTFTKADIVKGSLQRITYHVTKMKRYDFRVSVMGYDFEQSNVLIDQNEWVIKIKTKEFCQ